MDFSESHTVSSSHLSLSVGGELAVAEAAEEGSRALLPDRMATNVCCDHAEGGQSEGDVLYMSGDSTALLYQKDVRLSG